MKKILTLITLLILSVLLASQPALAADIDLSGMTYDELVELHDRIDLAIWNSQEWQEVTVPQGIYEVGKDIPAGHWTIKATVKNYTHVIWGESIDNYGQVKRFIDYEWIYSEFKSTYKENDDTLSVDWNLTDGTYIQVEDGYAVFTPYAGKPSLGFK